MRPGLALIALVAACGGKQVGEEAFLASLPPQARLQIGIGRQGSTRASSALAREAAEVRPLAMLYVATRRTSEQLNGLVGGVLGTVWAVASNGPASLTDTQAVYGPITPPLSPATYRLVIVRVGEGTFDYELDGRPKSSTDDAAFVPVLRGSGDDRTDRRRGNFSLSLSARHVLDPVETPQTGQIEAAFEIVPDKVSIGLHLQEVAGPGTPSVEGDYRFDQLADGSGDFRFGLEASDELSDAEVRSRWMPSGPGRGDADVYGPDGVHRITECWDASFARAFFAIDGKTVEGEAAACAFAEPLSPDA